MEDIHRYVCLLCGRDRWGEGFNNNKIIALITFPSNAQQEESRRSRNAGKQVTHLVSWPININLSQLTWRRKKHSQTPQYDQGIINLIANKTTYWVLLVALIPVQYKSGTNTGVN